jgi:type I restriction enzyme S subunit
MSDEAEDQTLSDVVVLQRGTTYKSALLGQPGPVLLGLASMQRDGGFRGDSLKTYGGPSADKLLLHPGDIYISLKDVTQSGDLLGAVARVPASVPEGRLTQDTVKLEVVEESVPNDYLYWLLRTPQYRAYCRSHAIGTTNLSLSRQDFLNFPVPTPSSHELSMTETLQALDDKIEVNRRISETLEEIARALFKSWFVDFDPVRGTATVPGDISQLFPDRLVDSRIGPVPEGWEVAPLGEHVEVTRGLSYTGAGLADEGMPMHNLNSIREGGGYKEDGIKYFKGEYRERDLVRPGEVIVANTEQGFEHLLIGYPAIVPRSFGEEGIYSHHIYRLRPLAGSPLTQRWLYLLLVGNRMHAQVAGYSNGTTVNMLPKDGIEKQLVAVPLSGLVERFDAIVAPMLDQQEALTAESKTLAELRDTLLPKLISGEVRLSAEGPGSA